MLDPELDQPLAELGMLGDVSSRRGGRVEVTIAAHHARPARCAARITEDVAAAVRRVAPGADPVVDLT